MKRALLGLAALVLVGLLVAAGVFVWIRKQQSRNVRGSSTVEFVATEPTAPAPNPELKKVPWPMYGYDVERTRFANGVNSVASRIFRPTISSLAIRCRGGAGRPRQVEVFGRE